MARSRHEEARIVNPITVYDTGPLGHERCPACQQVVYWAWDADMASVALESDLNGIVAVRIDGNDFPWCRDARGKQLAFGESLYRLHDPTCPGLATVTRIDRAPSVRRRPARPATPRRTASAR
jgi:hypothetical protein